REISLKNPKLYSQDTIFFKLDEEEKRKLDEELKKRKQNSDHLPMDIILEILSRSSAKSVATFGLASKFYASMLSRPDFTDLFLTRSSTRPRLLFAVEYYREWWFFSSPQPQNPDKKPRFALDADLQMVFPGNRCPKISGPVSGLVLFPSIRFSKKDKSVEVPVICNPSTGQNQTLPKLTRISTWTSFLGYDSIGKQYKVLTISTSLRGSRKEEGQILTLPSTGKLSWRNIKLLNHYPTSEGICIDGVLYYQACITIEVEKIACFDVRHEELSFLNYPRARYPSYSSSTKLINYKGKLGVISWHWEGPDYIKPICGLRLCLCILEDAKKQEWLQLKYTFPANVVVEGDVSLAGVTTTGEIIFSMDYTSKCFFVFYFNPERNTLTKVGIQGFGGCCAKVYTFVDYTEDLKFMK
ncbi:hypothetical protein EUTSA_v10015881mg, partial [Eutrema salsugineum]